MTFSISSHEPRELSRFRRTNSKSDPLIITEILAENRLQVKRHAAKPDLGHFRGVEKRKRNKPQPTETELLVMRRIKAELAAQKLNPTRLAKRARKVGLQRTLHGILAGADPRVSSIHGIAAALGVAPWRLFLPFENDERQETDKIIDVSPSYPMLTPGGKESRLSKSRRRKPKRG